MRAKERADWKRQREEDKLMKGILDRGAQGNLGSTGSWMDPDWMPEILAVGTSGKGRNIRSSNMDGDMPKIGHGRRNPNEKRRKK
jgi:RNA-binding protein NOB1